MYLSILLDTLVVTGPIFLLVLLGLVLRRAGFVDDHFVDVSSRLVFSLCLPVLLFITITDIDPAASLDSAAFFFSFAATALTFIISWVFAFVVQPREDRGVFVQGAFRSNLGVIGLALCANAYGPDGLAVASILMASMTIAYNVLSVFILSFYMDRELRWQKVLVDIVRNPLIIAIVIAAFVALLRIPVPGIIHSTGEYLGSLALPLALLGTGAGMNLRAMRDSSRTTTAATILKTAVLPLVVTLLAIGMGFRGTSLGVLFLLFVSPTATASFIMVKSMGGNDRLAANLVMVTTIVAILTTSIGLFTLKVLGLA